MRSVERRYFQVMANYPKPPHFSNLVYLYLRSMWRQRLQI